MVKSTFSIQCRETICGNQSQSEPVRASEVFKAASHSGIRYTKKPLNVVTDLCFLLDDVSLVCRPSHGIMINMHKWSHSLSLSPFTKFVYCSVRPSHPFTIIIYYSFVIYIFDEKNLHAPNIRRRFVVACGEVRLPHLFISLSSRAFFLVPKFLSLPFI